MRLGVSAGSGAAAVGGWVSAGTGGPAVPVAVVEPAGARVGEDVVVAGEGSDVADWAGADVADAAGVPGADVPGVGVSVQVAVGAAAVGNGASVGGTPVGGESVGGSVGGAPPVGVIVGMV